MLISRTIIGTTMGKGKKQLFIQIRKDLKGWMSSRSPLSLRRFAFSVNL